MDCLSSPNYLYSMLHGVTLYCGALIIEDFRREGAVSVKRTDLLKILFSNINDKTGNQV